MSSLPVTPSRLERMYRDAAILDALDDALRATRVHKSVLDLPGAEVTLWPEGYHVAPNAWSEPWVDATDLRTALATALRHTSVQPEPRASPEDPAAAPARPPRSPWRARLKVALCHFRGHPDAAELASPFPTYVVGPHVCPTCGVID